LLFIGLIFWGVVFVGFFSLGFILLWFFYLKLDVYIWEIHGFYSAYWKATVGLWLHFINVTK